MKIRKIEGGYDALNVLVIAGIHGDELTSMNVCDELINYFSKNKPDKTNLTFLNYVNEYGLVNCTREWATVENERDLNRYHFADSDIANERTFIKQQILQSDVVIDIHSSPNITEFFLIDNGSNINLDYFKENDFPFIVRDFDGKTIKRFCLNTTKNDKRILGFTFETRGLKEVDRVSAMKSFNILKQFIKNIHDVYDANKNAPSISMYFDELYQPIFSRCAGFIEGKFISKLGTFFKDNEIICSVIDYKNENREFKIKAPCSCYLVEFIDKDFVKDGEVVCSIFPCK